MKNVFLLICAILPVFIFGTYIYKKDSEKEPVSLLVALFLSGIFSAFLVLIVSMFLEVIFPLFRVDINDMNPLQLAIYIFIGVSLVEEGCKWFFSRLIGFKNKNFDQPYDIIVYATFVSLGFACFENILYVMEYGFSSAILRALTSIPGHTCFGIVMGYYLLLSKLSLNNRNQRLYYKNLLLSILIPVIAHGIYDYFLLLGNLLLLLILLVLFILFFIYSNKKIKQLSSLNYKLFYKNKYCPNCGSQVTTPYCSNCGNKRLQFSQGTQK